MKLRGIIAFALALACAPAFAQVNQGTSPLSIAKGGTAQGTAAAARGSSGLNVYGDAGTPHGDIAVVIGNTERFAYTSAAFTTSRTWTLPAANVTGAPYTVKVADLFGGVTATNTLVIARAGADTVNGGGTSVTIAAANGGYECSSDGTSKWSCLSMGTVAVPAPGVTSLTPGSGLVSSVTAGCSQTAITNTGTLYAAECVNAQVGTTYTIVDGDRGKLVTFSNAAAVAVTLPQAGAASAFQNGWPVDIRNKGAGTVTITPTTSTIDGVASLSLPTGQSARIVSDGTNYQTTALPSPKQFNQNGYTGLVKCGSVDAYGGNTFTAGGAASATQFLVNQISHAILCDGSAWVSAGWYPDNTAAKISNFIGPTFSNVHRAIDVSGQATIGGCSATGVSDETHIGCNDVSAPCHQASVATHCYIFLVAKTTTPATLNDVGLVVSNRIGTNGPSGTVQAIYPYYAPIAWNITTGQTTFAGETFQWYYGIFGNKYTMLGSTTGGAGILPAVQSGSTASVMTAFAIPSNYTSLNLSEAEFLLSNSGAAGSLCGMTPWSSWSTAVLRWPNNPGLANLGVTTGLMGPAGGQYAYISSVGQCNGYLYRWTDAYPFSSH